MAVRSRWALEKIRGLLGYEKLKPGFYDKHKSYYKELVPEVSRLVKNDSECQRVTDMDKRSTLQKMMSMFGVAAAGGLVFSVMALVKGNTKFKDEVLSPSLSLLGRDK